MLNAFTILVSVLVCINAEEFPIVAHYRRLLKYKPNRIRRNVDSDDMRINIPRRFEAGIPNYLDIYIYAPAKHTIKSTGESIHFDCELTQGYSAAWSRENGKEFSKYAELQKLHNRNIYRIDIENLHESDSGRYMCTANTGNPSDVESVYLEVRRNYFDEYDSQKIQYNGQYAVTEDQWQSGQHQQIYKSDDRDTSYDADSGVLQERYDGYDHTSSINIVDSQDAYKTDDYQNGDIIQEQENERGDYEIHEQYTTDRISEMDAAHPYYQGSFNHSTWNDQDLLNDKYLSEAAFQDDGQYHGDQVAEQEDTEEKHADMYTDYVYDYLMDD